MQKSGVERKEAKRVDYTIITRYIKLNECFNIAQGEEEAKQKTIWGKATITGKLFSLTR